MKFIYRTLCRCSALEKPSKIISDSIDDDDPVQFLKHSCILPAPCSQTAQYLFRTPMYVQKVLSFFYKNNTHTRESIITVFMCAFAPPCIHYNRYSWHILMIVNFLIAIDFSSFPADFIDSCNAVHCHFPITCSA